MSPSSLLVGTLVLGAGVAVLDGAASGLSAGQPPPPRTRLSPKAFIQSDADDACDGAAGTEAQRVAALGMRFGCGLAARVSLC